MGIIKLSFLLFTCLILIVESKTVYKRFISNKNFPPQQQQQQQQLEQQQQQQQQLEQQQQQQQNQIDHARWTGQEFMPQDIGWRNTGKSEINNQRMLQQVENPSMDYFQNSLKTARQTFQQLENGNQLNPKMFYYNTKRDATVTQLQPEPKPELNTVTQNEEPNQTQTDLKSDQVTTLSTDETTITSNVTVSNNETTTTNQTDAEMEMNEVTESVKILRSANLENLPAPTNVQDIQTVKRIINRYQSMMQYLKDRQLDIKKFQKQNSTNEELTNIEEFVHDLNTQKGRSLTTSDVNKLKDLISNLDTVINLDAIKNRRDEIEDLRKQIANLPINEQTDMQKELDVLETDLQELVPVSNVRQSRENESNSRPLTHDERIAQLEQQLKQFTTNSKQSRNWQSNNDKSNIELERLEHEIDQRLGPQRRNQLEELVLNMLNNNNRNAEPNFGTPVKPYIYQLPLCVEHQPHLINDQYKLNDKIVNDYYKTRNSNNDDLEKLRLLSTKLGMRKKRSLNDDIETNLIESMEERLASLKMKLEKYNESTTTTASNDNFFDQNSARSVPYPPLYQRPGVAKFQKFDDLFIKIVKFILHKLEISAPYVVDSLFNGDAYFSLPDNILHNDGAPSYRNNELVDGNDGGSVGFQGLFSFLPAILLKFFSNFSSFLNLLKRNNFFKNFLVPSGFILVVDVIIALLVWWLQTPQQIPTISTTSNSSSSSSFFDSF